MDASSAKLYRRARVVTLISMLAFGLWVGIWLLAVAQYNKVIDGWIATQRAAGYQVEFDQRMTVGFPHHIMMRFDNLRWKNTDNIMFKADHMYLSARPWQWQKFHAKLKGHIELSAPTDTDGIALSMGGSEGQATVLLDTDGVWKFSEVWLSQSFLGRAPDYLFHADFLKASAQRPDTPPHTHKDTGLTVEGTATNVAIPKAMPSPFGPVIANMHMTLRVMGDMPDFRLKSSVGAWNDDSGVVEFDDLQMKWGPMEMKAKGTIGFDDALQPEGAFSSSIGGIDAVVKALVDFGYIGARQKEMIDSAMDLFGKPDDGGGKDDVPNAINVPITVQLGGLFFGPIKIFNFPEIKWADGLPDAAP